MKIEGRQRQILKMIAEGETIQGIALVLHVSPKTVEYHWAKIRDRIGIRSIALCTQYALKHRIARRCV